MRQQTQKINNTLHHRPQRVSLQTPRLCTLLPDTLATPKRKVFLKGWRPVFVELAYLVWLHTVVEVDQDESALVHSKNWHLHKTKAAFSVNHVPVRLHLLVKPLNVDIHTGLWHYVDKDDLSRCEFLFLVVNLEGLAPAIAGIPVNQDLLATSLYHDAEKIPNLKLGGW